MKAFYITAKGKTEIREIPKPSFSLEEVLLKVQVVGFCGSDLNTFRGKNPMVSYPRIPGHEVAATVAEKGKDVPEHIRIGQNVTLSPYTSCGTCASCRKNRPNACQFNQTLGVQRDGALAEYIAIDWRKLYFSDNLPLEELALVEPLTVGFHASARGEIGSGDTTMVLGCGAIGLGAIAGSSWRGGKVIAVDIDDKKLAIAEKAGADFVINSQSQDLHTELEKLTDGGPDVVIEAIGMPSTFKAAVEEVAFCGRVVYIGYAKDPVTYDTKLFVQKELDIRGSRNALEDFADVITILESGKFPVDSVITHRFPLSKAGEALIQWDADPVSVTKILIEMPD